MKWLNYKQMKIKIINNWYLQLLVFNKIIYKQKLLIHRLKNQRNYQQKYGIKINKDM